MRNPQSVSRIEVYRYMGFRDGMPEPHLQDIYEEVIGMVSKSAKPKFCRLDTSIKISDRTVEFDGFSVKSDALSKHLNNCERGVIFAATLGIAVDMLIYKYSMISPVKAVAAQAAATAMIEMCADDLCAMIEEESKCCGEYITSRFSPGYGDLSLSCQSDFLRVLDAGKKIGLCLTDADMLTPIKSITAVVGKTKKGTVCVTKKCSSCENKSCIYRK